MVNLWKQVRFIEIVDPGNQFVKNLMFDGVYSSDFALLSEDIPVSYTHLTLPTK